MSFATALAVLVYLPIVALGGWYVVTGRAVPPDIAHWSLPNGLPIRLFGLVSMFVALAIIGFILRNSLSWEGLAATYFFATWSLVTIILRARKRGAASAPRQQQLD